MHYWDKLDKDKRKTILLLNWRDIKNPKAGGAEVHTHEMIKRSAGTKYRTIHISPMFPDALDSECIDGVHYIRRGGPFSVIFWAFLYYKRNHTNIDIVIDQCNAHRFFTKFWVPKRKRIFYTHQLYRELWDIMLPGVAGKVGKALESPLLRLNKNDTTITVSESTKNGLIEVGFKPENIFLIPNGLNFHPKSFSELKEKGKTPIFIYVGRFVPYKGINKAVEAFCRVHQEYPDSKLWIVGRTDEDYVAQVLHPICVEYNVTDGAKDNDDIRYFGFVSEQKKYDLLEKAVAQLFPATREGWGIVITEAAVMGTPSIVSNCPGCVDAVDHGNAGYLCHENTVDEIVKYMKDAIENKEEYETMRKKAYNYSVQFNWDNSAQFFDQLIDGKVNL
ncbi:MAG: glycosyltransferase family 4 protein [Clostridiales bacterium]|nr:glycosyltransferase family 4 protein [Clostridiales bacterium]